jgi:hypothetical protein
MTGFYYAEAKGLKVKPVVEVFKGAGTVTIKTGKLTTLLPEKAAPRPWPNLPRAARSTRQVAGKAIAPLPPCPSCNPSPTKAILQ